MKLTDLFTMLGGLALFLYGMTMMSNGLELAAGNKMKSISRVSKQLLYYHLCQVLILHGIQDFF